MKRIKNITLSKRNRTKALHIEVPGGIVIIHIGLTDEADNAVTYVSVSADGDRYAGQSKWWLVANEANPTGIGMRLVEEKKKG